MLQLDESALICDLAETYHVFDYRALPLHTVCALASGLRDDSRIKLKLVGVRYGVDTMLLSIIADRLATLVWFQTKDGQDGVNRPESIYEHLFGAAEKVVEYEAFTSGEDFMKRFEELTKGGGGENGTD